MVKTLIFRKQILLTVLFIQLTNKQALVLQAQLDPHQSIPNLVVKKLRGLSYSTEVCPEPKS
jgi:hypothetical protein